MTEHKSSLVEQLREQAARRWKAHGALNAARTRDRLIGEWERNVKDGVAPDYIRVLLNPSDYARLAPDVPDFRADMLQLFAEQCRVAGYTTNRKLSVHFGMDHSVPPDTVNVRATISRPSLGRLRKARKTGETPSPLPPVPVEMIGETPPSEPAVVAVTIAGGHPPAPETPTQAEVAVDIPGRLPTPASTGFSLRLPGGESIPVSCFPFTIGRAPDNKLPLASFAVSRHHATLTRDDEGLKLQDVGSRNGIVVEGERKTEVRLVPGSAFILGDIELRLEEHAG